MNAQATQKKTLKIRTGKPRAEEVGDASPTEGTGEGAAGPVRETAPVESAPPPRKASYTLSVVFALIAIITFAVLIVLQWREYSYYSSAFPPAVSHVR